MFICARAGHRPGFELSRPLFRHAFVTSASLRLAGSGVGYVKSHGMRNRFNRVALRRREVGSAGFQVGCAAESAVRPLQKRRTGLAPCSVAAVNLELGSHNSLFIRGKGGGLSWTKGQALTCIDPTTWIWSTRTPSEKVEFQLVLNDEVWEKGDTHVLEPGASIEFTPDFEWPEIPRISSIPSQ